MQLADPVAALYVPATHAVHASPSALAVCPAIQTQSVSSLPSAELVVVEAGQSEQSPTPVALLYVSATHAVHTSPSDAPLYPASHSQSANASLPDAELVPAGHVEQSPTPVATLYSPASHAVHASPSEAAVYPATHTQSVKASLPPAELVCEGHAVQLPDPVVALYFPASHAVHASPFALAVCPTTHTQSVSASLAPAELVCEGHAEHATAPVTVLYVPASHAVHATPFSPAVYPATHTQSVTAVEPSSEEVWAGQPSHA